MNHRFYLWERWAGNILQHGSKKVEKTGIDLKDEGMDRIYGIIISQ
jgi:hypothetical protein